MSELIDRAFLLASTLHASQTRKQPTVPGGTRAPYMSHLMGVASEVQACGAPDEVVAAALLHDAVEDQGMSAADYIVEQCGPEVLALVMECTEAGTGGTKKAPWQERKDAYLAHLDTVSPGALLISVADKLQSLRELWRQVRAIGDPAYLPFVKEVPEPARKPLVLWFQRSFADRVAQRLYTARQPLPELSAVNMLLQDFRELLEKMEQ